MKPAKSKKIPSQPSSSSASYQPSPASASPGNANASAGSLPQELVAERAHSLWEQRGRPADQDLEIWLEAERQLGGQGKKQAVDQIKPKIDQTEPEESLTSEVEREMNEETSGGSRRSATSL